ncbi:MAG: hypothetical protein J6J81_03950, partial [Oscillospiraceae bacterium]|nr:hypothetical protein [Oscillospiraceae bacterium]
MGMWNDFFSKGVPLFFRVSKAADFVAVKTGFSICRSTERDKVLFALFFQEKGYFPIVATMTALMVCIRFSASSNTT